MRIAFVSLMGGLPWGGSEALWHAVAIHALKQGDKVFVSVYDWGTLHHKVRELQGLGATIHTRKRYNPNAGFTERIGRFIKKRKPSLDRNYQAITVFRPDVVFISQGDSFDLAIHHRSLYKLLQAHAIPYTLVCHNHVQYSWLPPAEIFPRAIDIFRDAKRVFFVSHRQWQLTERRLATKLSNATLTWNPLNLELPSVPLPWPAGETVCFAMVANLIGAKGHDTAFEVFSQEQWRSRQWRLNIYGTGEGLTYLQNLAGFYGIDDKIFFKGHTEDIQGVWMENHLLLIPSAGEGLPISLVETMACGRPAVVTDVGGNIELISEVESGFIAVSPTTQSFGCALEKAWQKKQHWQQIGVNAFLKMHSIYEKDPHVKIYQILSIPEREGITS
ncbi:MAG: glycosyltransferase [Flavobacterium sp.]|nr:MAG: glycosyltransferase [Flavobacterium sp.]